MAKESGETRVPDLLPLGQDRFGTFGLVVGGSRRCELGTNWEVV